MISITMKIRVIAPAGHQQVPLRTDLDVLVGGRGAAEVELGVGQWCALDGLLGGLHFGVDV
jgi:hypothetical protein